MQKIVDAARPKLPRGSQLVIRGQVQTMRSSFQDLAFGLIFAVVLVYMLIVVNFQSWTDPFIIITGLPGALAGISWMLFITGTTLSVPALMGAIMCIGVATSNGRRKSRTNWDENGVFATVRAHSISTFFSTVPQSCRAKNSKSPTRDFASDVLCSRRWPN